MSEELPALGYDGGTSGGWSGTDTSEAGATNVRKQKTIQQRVLDHLFLAGSKGMTVKEVRESLAENHHGNASRALSNLDKLGKVALIAERRDGCYVYVLAENRDDRLLAPRKHRKPAPVTMPEGAWERAEAAFREGFSGSTNGWVPPHDLSLFRGGWKAAVEAMGGSDGR